MLLCRHGAGRGCGVRYGVQPGQDSIAPTRGRSGENRHSWNPDVFGTGRAAVRNLDGRIGAEAGDGKGRAGGAELEGRGLPQRSILASIVDDGKSTGF